METNQILTIGAIGGFILVSLSGFWLTLMSIVGVGLYFVHEYFQGGRCTSTDRVDGKVVVLTGGNTGIGKETAMELSKRGAKVIIGCRDTEKGQQAAQEIRDETGNDVIVMKLDLADFKSVREFAKAVSSSESKIDILINNAGVMMCPYWKTVDGHEMQWQTNHLGHFLLTNLLLPNLKKGAPSRVVNVSSLAHFHIKGGIQWDDINFENTSYTSHKAYCQSKLANVLFTKELAKKLKGTGVTTYSLHPGVVDTELSRHIQGWFPQFLLPIGNVTLKLFMKTAKNGAQTSIRCAVDKSLEKETGKYYADCEEQEPAKYALDESSQRKLWELSEKMVKLNEDVDSDAEQEDKVVVKEHPKVEAKPETPEPEVKPETPEPEIKPEVKPETPEPEVKPETPEPEGKSETPEPEVRRKDSENRKCQSSESSNEGEIVEEIIEAEKSKRAEASFVPHVEVDHHVEPTKDSSSSESEEEEVAPVAVPKVEAKFIEENYQSSEPVVQTTEEKHDSSSSSSDSEPEEVALTRSKREAEDASDEEEHVKHVEATFEKAKDNDNKLSDNILAELESFSQEGNLKKVDTEEKVVLPDKFDILQEKVTENLPREVLAFSPEEALKKVETTEKGILPDKHNILLEKTSESILKEVEAFSQDDSLRKVETIEKVALPDKYDILKEKTSESLLQEVESFSSTVVLKKVETEEKVSLPDKYDILKEKTADSLLLEVESFSQSEVLKKVETVEKAGLPDKYDFIMEKASENIAKELVSFSAEENLRKVETEEKIVLPDKYDILLEKASENILKEVETFSTAELTHVTPFESDPLALLTRQESLKAGIQTFERSTLKTTETNEEVWSPTKDELVEERKIVQEEVQHQKEVFSEVVKNLEESFDQTKESLKHVEVTTKVHLPDKVELEVERGHAEVLAQIPLAQLSQTTETRESSSVEIAKTEITRSATLEQVTTFDKQELKPTKTEEKIVLPTQETIQQAKIDEVLSGDFKSFGAHSSNLLGDEGISEARISTDFLLPKKINQDAPKGSLIEAPESSSSDRSRNSSSDSNKTGSSKEWEKVEKPILDTNQEHHN